MSSCHCPRATSERERESGEVFASFQSPTVFTAHTRWTRFCLQTCVEEVSSQSHSSETVSQGKVGGLVGISFPWQGAAHKSQTSNRTLSKAVLPCSAHPQCSQRDQTTSRVPLFKKRSPYADASAACWLLPHVAATYWGPLTWHGAPCRIHPVCCKSLLLVRPTTGRRTVVKDSVPFRLGAACLRFVGRPRTCTTLTAAC